MRGSRLVSRPAEEATKPRIEAAAYPRRVPLRVLHCPTNVGNHPQGLARAERRLGLQSRCVELDPGWIEYRVDEPAPRNSGRLEAKRWRVLGQALRRYDVIHFNFGR